MSAKEPQVAIVIPVFNRKQITLNCLRQLNEIIPESASFKVVIVDDGSTDGTGEAVKESFPDAVVLAGDGNLWWTGAINVGVQYALDSGFDYVLCLNDDLELDTQFYQQLMLVAEKHPNALVSSVKLVKQDDGTERVNTAGFEREGFFLEITGPDTGENYEEEAFPEVIEREILTGAALLIPCEVFRRIGLMDEKHYPHNWGDFEFTLRAFLNGFPCLVAAHSKIYIDGYNPNYYHTYAIQSTRMQYIKNLFENHKYHYGFKSVWYQCFIHRPVYKASLLFAWRSMGILRGIFLKLILPNPVFARFTMHRLNSR